MHLKSRQRRQLWPSNAASSATVREGRGRRGYDVITEGEHICLKIRYPTLLLEKPYIQAKHTDFKSIEVHGRLYWGGATNSALSLYGGLWNHCVVSTEVCAPSVVSQKEARCGASGVG